MKKSVLKPKQGEFPGPRNTTLRREVVSKSLEYVLRALFPVTSPQFGQT